MNTTNPNYGQEGYSPYRQDLAMIGIVLFFVTAYCMPKTIRRFSIALYTFAIMSFAAFGSYTRIPRTPGPGEVVTAQLSDRVITYSWWGWLGVAGLVYLACMAPKVIHHINFHTYQKRPGLFSKTIESERFSWFPPFGTVHMHGCNGPTRTDWAQYEQAQREATYGYVESAPAVRASWSPPVMPQTPLAARQPVAVVEAPVSRYTLSDEQLRREAAARGRDAQRVAQRPIFAANASTVYRVEQHPGFIINDRRGFDPEVD